jgi:hypothetical protein
MKCPNCKHESKATLLRCSACGEAFERETLERLGHLEYLLAWLDDRAEKLGSEVHALMRSEASGELNATLEGLGLKPPELVPEVTAPEPLIQRPPEEIAHEAGCLELILDHIHNWGKRVSVPDEMVASFRSHILRKAVDFKDQLRGHEVEVIPPTGIEAINYALEMLPSWVEDLRLDPPAVVCF